MQTTKIYLQTGYLLDTSFERVLANQATIARLLPQMQQAWDTLSSSLIDTTTAEIGKEFRRRELIAYLTMHPTMFFCSHPFLININRFLDFDGSSQEQVLKFCDVVFHEALHIYLDDNFADLLDETSSGASPLIKKFEHMGPHVIAHIHLYAIQKHIYQKLKLASAWDDVCEHTKISRNDGYLKAVDLVNEVGAEAFIDELK